MELHQKWLRFADRTMTKIVVLSLPSHLYKCEGSDRIPKSPPFGKDGLVAKPSTRLAKQGRAYQGELRAEPFPSTLQQSPRPARDGRSGQRANVLLPRPQARPALLMRHIVLSQEKWRSATFGNDKVRSPALRKYPVARQLVGATARTRGRATFERVTLEIGEIRRHRKRGAYRLRDRIFTGRHV